MKPMELAFFAVAVLLPLVGGGTLLFVLSRGSSKEKAKEKKGTEGKEKESENEGENGQ